MDVAYFVLPSNDSLFFLPPPALWFFVARPMTAAMPWHIFTSSQIAPMRIAKMMTNSSGIDELLCHWGSSPRDTGRMAPRTSSN